MTAVLCTNHSWPFEKAYTPIYLTFHMFSSRIDALSHTFAYGRLQCLSESRGGSHETKSIFRICARRYSPQLFLTLSFPTTQNRKKKKTQNKTSNKKEYTNIYLGETSCLQSVVKLEEISHLQRHFQSVHCI